jgi:hypothetical protein
VEIDPQAMELEMAVARERFRSRIVRLSAVTVAVDVVAGVLAFFLERGAHDAFSTVWAALFWTSTQLLTISSSLSNPEHTATKVLDVALELYAIIVVTSLAATFTDSLHHRTRRRVHERALAARSGVVGDK